MAERELRISSGLGLPLSVAGEFIGVLATRGAGKSYTSAVLVEELHAAGVQLVVLDPTGVYWGLRSSADGKKGGLPIFVLGGAHADGGVALEPASGKLIADVIVDTGQSLILDLSDFETKAAQTRFVADLAERLYHRKARSRSTLHIVLDEANEFAPQQARYGGDTARMLGAIERLVGKGRSRGLAGTLITQRSAALNKNVLDLIDTLIAMRVLGPRDRRAIADWIVVKQADDTAGVIDSLPSLPTGTAWVWSPVRGILQKVVIRRIKTFDSYRTPEPGEQRVEPTARAPLDVAQLGEQIQATAERAKADDPRELRAEIARLRSELSQRPSETVELVEKIEYVDRPVISDADRAFLQNLHESLQANVSIVEGGAAVLKNVVEDFLSVANKLSEAAHPDERRPAVVIPIDRGPRPSAETPARPAGKPRPEPSTNGVLPKGERTILIAVAQYPMGAARDQLTVLTGYKSSSRNTYLQRLSSAGYVEIAGGLVRATDAGIAALGSDYEPLPTGAALQDYWREKLPEGERRILDVLITAYPDVVRREKIDEPTGYKPSSRNTYLQRLRSRRLVDNVGPSEVRASEDLF